MDSKTFGKRVAELRNIRGITQQQLADELFVACRVVSKWEIGAGLPDAALYPHIALALGVSVNDLMSKRSFKKAKRYLRKKHNIPLISMKERLIIITFISVVLIAFVAWNIYWSMYISNTFDPFLNHERLQDVPVRVERRRGAVTYIFTDTQDSGYTYQFNIPRRLNFGGSITIGRSENIGANDITINIFTSPRDWRYVLILYDIENRSFMEDGEQVNETVITAFGSLVDRYGQPLARQLEEDDEHQEWLIRYEERYNDIIRHFRDMKDFFGEEVFR
jgi:transcriptional regulator with XRE-family HTH domain